MADNHGAILVWKIHGRLQKYHGGNFVFKSIDRGDSFKIISPNLSISPLKEKKSFALGALVESRIEKGLLFAGTDKGAFWVSKDDGGHWQENSTGLANNYIRSISPSRFSKQRVYLAMTGINYDDLHKYLYVSEDYGQHWKSISDGLPDEPVNVVLEDPFYENILYAGSIRGVYVSIDRGGSWSCLGMNMAGAAIADIEVNSKTKDLIVATHGRGLYKMNLKPIHQLQEVSRQRSQDIFFEIPKATLPWYNSAGGEVDYRTLERVPISFWLAEAKQVDLTLNDKDEKVIWTVSINGKKGFNQHRWDQVIGRTASDHPYFIHYEKFLKPGTYQMSLKVGNSVHAQTFVATNNVSPYLKK